jgi:hypothetical protein
MIRDTPKSAKGNWQLWKLCQELNLEEIQVLVGKRKNDLKYEKDAKKIKDLKRDISILLDAYEIIRKRRNE